jgi:hypothetical protein
MLQNAKLSISMFLGLAFLVVAAPVISRCYAQRVPVIRLMKGRRISSLVAADNWKIGIDAVEEGAAGQIVATESAMAPRRPSWLRRIASIATLAEILPIQRHARQVPLAQGEHFSAIGIPLRC